MHIYSIPISEIQIEPGRQRKDFDPAKIIELGDSIVKNGLIHPVVVRREPLDKGAVPQIFLVAGERRLKAFLNIWAMGDSFTCGGEKVDEGEVPCLLYNDLSELEAKEIELDENIKRTDLSWQERAAATQELLTFRIAQAKQAGSEAVGQFPSGATIAQELEANPEAVRIDLLVASHLNDPEVAKAPSAREALKILKRKETTRQNLALGVSVGLTFSASDHTLLQGNCLHEMGKLAEDSFDVILTDPPYGINAGDFGDSGGHSPTAGHFYEDGFDYWFELMGLFASASYRIAKMDSHLYAFCDLDNFVLLKKLMTSGGWKCFRTPIIWHNPTGNRAPWPDYGPQRKYQVCLYAIKGRKPVNQLFPDVVTYPSDENLGHPAQKPVALYQDLLKRSCRPGDTVIDPFCGSGTIFPAAHGLKVKATGIEQDASAYGLAAKRLGELK